MNLIRNLVELAFHFIRLSDILDKADDPLPGRLNFKWESHAWNKTLLGKLTKILSSAKPILVQHSRAKMKFWKVPCKNWARYLPKMFKFSPIDIFCKKIMLQDYEHKETKQLNLTAGNYLFLGLWARINELLVWSTLFYFHLLNLKVWSNLRTQR